MSSLLTHADDLGRLGSSSHVTQTQPLPNEGIRLTWWLSTVAELYIEQEAFIKHRRLNLTLRFQFPGAGLASQVISWCEAELNRLQLHREGWGWGRGALSKR